MERGDTKWGEMLYFFTEISFRACGQTADLRGVFNAGNRFEQGGVSSGGLNGAWWVSPDKR